MIKEIAYYLIFGKPLIFYFGVITLLSFLITATIGYINLKKGITKNLLSWHLIMATTSIILALLHALLGLSLYFNF